MAETSLKSALEMIGLGAFNHRFNDQKIDISMIINLTDKELTQLGIETIGDRARLRVASREYQTPTLATVPNSSNENGTTTASETLQNSTNRMSSEIGALFGPSRSRFSNRLRKEKSACKQQRTYTGKFLCLSDKMKINIPKSEEKVALQKCGLGIKKIQFNVTDGEEKVYEIICSQYPPLKNCGGFELLRCSSNCKTLQMLEGKWDIHNLKTLVGSQCTIYIRPIQRNIIMPTNVPEVNEIKEECSVCKKQVLLSNLRTHLDECELSKDVLPDLTVDDQNNVEMLVSFGNEDVQIEVTANSEQEASFLEQTAREEFNLVDNEVVHEEFVNDIYHDIVQTYSVSDIVRQTEEFATLHNISNPVEILRLFQKEVVTGRKLDIENETEELMGLTNFIMVDRSNCLETAVEENKSIKDLRLCLEVQFFGEEAKDLGGPRKEFFTIVLQRIQEEYFNPVKEWSDDYEIIGKIFALSTLQNGKLPRVLSAELLTEVFQSDSTRKFVKDLRTGLDALGLYQLVQRLPIMIHLFTQQTIPLTFRMLSTLIKPSFSIDGSNQRMVENTTYQHYIKYLRETAAGRRPGVSLDNILRFVTGADEEPALGFSVEPSLHFVKSESFLPTASTCANRLNLNLPTDGLPMPPKEELFNLFDYAFLNSFFGFA